MSDEYKIGSFVYFRTLGGLPWLNGLYIKYDADQYKGHLVRNSAGTIFVIRNELNLKLAEVVNAS